MGAKGNWHKSDIQVGLYIDTHYETECEVVTEPDENGDFTAYDSGGQEATYNVSMVTNIYDYVN